MHSSSEGIKVSSVNNTTIVHGAHPFPRPEIRISFPGGGVAELGTTGQARTQEPAPVQAAAHTAVLRNQRHPYGEQPNRLGPRLFHIGRCSRR